MKLEQAIKQSRFKTLDLHLALNFMYTYNCFMNDQKAYFDAYGITQQQYNVLRILRGHHPDPYSTAQIRERMLDKMSDASRIVDRLVKKQLVNRTVCLADKRLVDVVISTNGMSLLNKIDKTIDAQLKKSFHRLKVGDKKKLIDLLDQVRR